MVVCTGIVTYVQIALGSNHRSGYHIGGVLVAGTGVLYRLEVGIHQRNPAHRSGIFCAGRHLAPKEAIGICSIDNAEFVALLIRAVLRTEDGGIDTGVYIGVGNGNRHIHLQAGGIGNNTAGDGGLQLHPVFPGFTVVGPAAQHAPAHAILIHIVRLHPQGFSIRSDVLINLRGPGTAIRRTVERTGRQIRHANQIINRVGVTVRHLPACHQGLSIVDFANLCYSSSIREHAFIVLAGTQVPAHKRLGTIGGDNTHRLRSGHIVVLNRSLGHGAAIGIQLHTDELGRYGTGIHAVEVHIGLNLPAIVIIRAGIPAADGTEELAALGLAGNGRLEITGTGGPGGAVLEREQNHGIMLALGQGQALLAGKAVDSFIQILQGFPQGCIRFLFGNGMITMTLLFLTLRTIADVAVGITGLAISFQLLQNGNRAFADRQSSGEGRQRSGGNQTGCHEQSHQKAQESLLHSNLLLLSYVSNGIITDPITNCNPHFENNYIFVTILRFVR